MQKRNYQGIWAASLTPLDAHLNCEIELLTAHCLSLLKRGCEGIVLFGTTGEGPSFSVEERIHCLKEIIQRGVPAHQILLGNGSSNLADSILLAKAVHESECAGLLAAPPSFFKHVSEEGVLEYYRALARSYDKVPLLLYHIPQYTGVPLSLFLIGKLLEEFPQQIQGFKESEGNPQLIEQILHSFPQLQLLVGSEKLIYHAVRKGARGAIVGFANLYAEWLVSLYSAAQLGQEIDLKPLEHVSSSIKHYPFIAASKAILEKMTGNQWQRVRPPLTSLSSKEREMLLEALKDEKLRK